MFTMKFWHNFLDGSIQCETYQTSISENAFNKVDKCEVSKDNIDLNPEKIVDLII